MADKEKYMIKVEGKLIEVTPDVYYAYFHMERQERWQEEKQQEHCVQQIRRSRPQRSNICAGKGFPADPEKSKGKLLPGPAPTLLGGASAGAAGQCGG